MAKGCKVFIILVSSIKVGTGSPPDILLTPKRLWELKTREPFKTVFSDFQVGRKGAELVVALGTREARNSGLGYMWEK